MNVVYIYSARRPDARPLARLVPADRSELCCWFFQRKTPVAHAWACLGPAASPLRRRPPAAMGECRALLLLTLLLCGSAVPSPQRGSGIAGAAAQITPTSNGAGGDAYSAECVYSYAASASAASDCCTAASQCGEPAGRKRRCFQRAARRLPADNRFLLQGTSWLMVLAAFLLLTPHRASC